MVKWDYEPSKIIENENKMFRHLAILVFLLLKGAETSGQIKKNNCNEQDV